MSLKKIFLSLSLELIEKIKKGKSKLRIESKVSVEYTPHRHYCNKDQLNEQSSYFLCIGNDINFT